MNKVMYSRFRENLVIFAIIAVIGLIVVVAS
jgi:hypothetical protein